MRFKWLILLVFIHCITPLFVHASTIPAPSEVLSWVDQAAKSNKGLKEKLNSLNDSYEIVFIPGILGSELTIGNYVYGRDAIKADKLVFDPKQRVDARTLNTFPAVIGGRIFNKVDIYGSGLDSLKSGNHGKAAKEFAYDWRADIRVSAKKFNEYAKKTLSGKNVVIIAHSMGGLVAWQWKNIYRKEKRPFNLIAIVLIGTPMQGSCEPARMLVEGYSAPERSNEFEKWATHLVFDNAHPAIFTFPSVFQLLPKYNDDSPCIKMKLPAGVELSQNHHLIDTWLGRTGGDYRLGGTDDQTRKEFFNEIGLDAESYYARVIDAIEAGKLFRSNFDLNHQDDDRVYYLYSDAFDTGQFYHIVSKNGWLDIERVKSIKGGDGRVLYESATNKEKASPINGTALLLHKEHGKLLSDPDFPKFVSRDIDQLIKHSKAMKILAFAIHDPDLKKEIENRGWRILDSSSPTKSLTSDPDFVSARQTVALYNASQLPDKTLASTEKLINCARSIQINLKESPEEGEKIVASLLDSALVLDPDKIGYDDLEQLGIIRHNQKRYAEAISAYNEAIRKLNSSPESLKSGHEKVRLYTTLGDTYERLGAADLAANARNEAAQITTRLVKSDIGPAAGTTVAAGATTGSVGVSLIAIAILIAIIVFGL